MKGPANAIGINAKNIGHRKATLRKTKTAATDKLDTAIFTKSRCLRWITRKMFNSRSRDMALE
jgi:hypothetical protein